MRKQKENDVEKNELWTNVVVTNNPKSYHVFARIKNGTGIDILGHLF